MKVLLISVRDDGGGAKHLLQILTHHQSDIEFYVAAPLRNPLGTQIQEHADCFIEIPFRRFSLLAFLKLAFLCKREGITTVHSHGRGAGWYSRGLKLFGLRVIHTLHGTHIENHPLNFIKVCFDKLFVPLTDTFICVSNGEQKEAAKNGLIDIDRSVVIFNGIEIPTDLPPQRKKAEGEPYKVAMLGRLCYQKGYDLMIASVEDFCREYPDFDFEVNVGGDGGDYTALMNQLGSTSCAKSKINFLGHVEDTTSFLIEHDLFLSFSRFEGMPYAVLEAMSLGLPCLVSDVVGNNDLINEDNGFLFTQKDFKKHFHEANTKSSAPSNSNKKEIREKYNLKENIKKINDLYLKQQLKQ